MVAMSHMALTLTEVDPWPSSVRFSTRLTGTASLCWALPGASSGPRFGRWVWFAIICRLHLHLLTLVNEVL